MLCSDLRNGGSVATARSARLRRRSGAFVLSGSGAAKAGGVGAGGSMVGSVPLAGGSCTVDGGSSVLACSIMGCGGAGGSSAVDVASSEPIPRPMFGSLAVDSLPVPSAGVGTPLDALLGGGVDPMA